MATAEPRVRERSSRRRNCSRIASGLGSRSRKTWRSAAGRANLWTVDFPDPIVNPQRGVTHKVWIDHILASPNLVRADAAVRVVPDSGRIDVRDTTSRRASDHFAVHCALAVP